MKIYEFVNRSRNSLGVTEAAIHTKIFIKTVLPNQGQNPKPWLRASFTLCHEILLCLSSFISLKIFITYSLWQHINTLLFWTHFSVLLLFFFFPSYLFSLWILPRVPQNQATTMILFKVPALDHCATLNLPISSFCIVMNVLWGQKTWFRSSSVSSYLILDKLLKLCSNFLIF